MIIDPKEALRAHRERVEAALLQLRTRAVAIGGHSTEGQDIFRVVSEFAKAVTALVDVQTATVLAILAALNGDDDEPPEEPKLHG